MVVQAVVKANSQQPKQWERANFDPPVAERISVKLGI